MSASSSLLLVSAEKEVPKLSSVSSSVLHVIIHIYRVVMMYQYTHSLSSLNCINFTYISLFLSLTFFMSTIPPVFSLNGSSCKNFFLLTRYPHISWIIKINRIKTIRIKKNLHRFLHLVAVSLQPTMHSH